MKLQPYASVAERRRKVFKHVFDLRERWWDVFGDLLSWHKQYTVLRGLGCVAEGWQRAIGDEQGEQVLDTNHAPWLASAERACDEAREARRVYPSDEGRSCYVGKLGVTVVVAAGHLVTCFRPSQCLGSRLSEEEVTGRVDNWARRRTGFAERAAVRRAARRASLSAHEERTS